MTSTSISLVASTTLIVMIPRNKNGFRSPYSRIIYGMALGDFLFSLGIIISPFAAPKDTPNALWAQGTVESCEFAGFFMNFMSIVPFYAVFLTYYFFKRVVKKVPRGKFALSEPYFHAFIWTYAILGGFIGLAMDAFNPTRAGSMCIMIENPLGCHANQDVTCKRGSKFTTSIGSIYEVVIPALGGFIFTFLNLARFTFYIFREERLLVKSKKLAATNAALQPATPALVVQVESSVYSTMDTKEVIENFKQERKAIRKAHGLKVSENSAEISNDSEFDTSDLGAYTTSSVEPFSSQSDNLSGSVDAMEFQASYPLTTDDNAGLDNNSSNPEGTEDKVYDLSGGEEGGTLLRTRDEENEQDTTSRKSNDSEQYGLPLAKRALVQSFLYILSFVVAYAIPLAGTAYRIINKSKVPEWVFIGISLFAPLGGFFNILIYTRPKIASIRKLYPDYANSYWIKLFFMVVLHGGEVPDEIDDERVMRNPESSDAPNVSYFEKNQSKLEKYDELEEGAQNQNDLSNNEKQKYSLAVSSGDIVSNGFESIDVHSKTSGNDAGYYHYAIPPSKNAHVEPRHNLSSNMGDLQSIPEGDHSVSVSSPNILGFESSIQIDSESEQEESLKNL
ncbi:hypothetical protein CTEN210_00825 [Chaetoceros tenuissimus]|uniref:G-protein coupled receptors family 1 profile domain-containing protein n=1 Tax=Chaetoceros tenuissimus TaxID=426638 RepID=A0AAD3CEI8_9STRA|nr:hypothetical protein CTEN210_00825 [Chaetoceros tenuissimus]